MKAKVHYVMPMAGRGSRFRDNGFDFPKPLIEIYGKPFFYWATQSVKKYIDIVSFDFIVLQEHIDKYHIDNVIKNYYHEARIHALDAVTKGAVITCINGVDCIQDKLPIIFNDCDHLFKCDKLNLFCNEQFDSSVDGVLLTFESNEPKFSFVEKDIRGNVLRTAEKEAISNEAICGCYYFSCKDIFLKYAKEYLTKCNYNEYYMSGVYNVMLEHGRIVQSMLTDFHVTFGIPGEYDIAKSRNEYEALE